MYAKSGWAGYGDWLGTGRVANQSRQFRSFKKNRAFVRGLKLKSSTEWSAYCQSGKKPDDIPANPQLAYTTSGWAGYGDWLGTGRVANQLQQYRSFKEARAFVHGLKLKSYTEWRHYFESGKKPADIPAKPERAYAKSGWAGHGDWLGTGRVANRSRQFRSFKKNRAFVRGLKLKSVTEWRHYCKSGKKPDDIPTAPQQKYAEAGWAGYGDWLGTGRHRGKGWRNFKGGRAFVHGLKLKSSTEWRAYCQSGKKPDDIPANPHNTYAEAGWAGYGDWLGTGTVASFLRHYRSFKKARAFVRDLEFLSVTEWQSYCRSGKKPEDIPAAPQATYAEAGWSGVGDWLGYTRKRQS